MQNETDKKSGPLFAQVVVKMPVDKVYTYLVPPEFHATIRPGMMVRVPFGRKEADGYCVGIEETSSAEKIKAIRGILDDKVLVDENMLKLTRWIADYYFSSWGAALDCVVPGGVKRNTMGRQVEFVSLAIDEAKAREAVALYREKSPPRARVIEALLAAGEAMPVARLRAEADCSVSPIKTLAKDGLLRIEKQHVVAQPFENLQAERRPHLEFTPQQTEVFAKIAQDLDAKKYGAAMLNGVTGSGKTEIYLQAIDRVLKQGRQAIVLVPEISLTPQTVMRFRERFDDIAVLHGMMSDSQRREQWMNLREGKASIVIGARSAIFAPVPNLGLIIVDEEHESSFKQPRSPRYNARDVALMRASIENAYVILGSATPSLETYFNASTGKYARFDLPLRVGGLPMPEVEMVDMRVETRETKKSPLLSRRLLELIGATLGRGEQALLFLNRRGFSTHIDCPSCGLVLKCNRCDVSLTFHKKRNRTVCHYCNTEYEVPQTCPACGGKLRYFGVGTEKVDAEIERMFPEARLLRMDSDTMTGRNSHEDAFRMVASGKADILLGTQMIAKGLHFPRVTLVGIVLADTPLFIPDFRSAERAFQLISQVAGRTGRSERGGRVLVQTLRPDHFSIRYAARHDYEAFAREELRMRRQLGYPPYSRLARFVIEGTQSGNARAKCGEIAAALREASRDIKLRIVGPAPAPIAVIGNKTRYHILAMAPTSGDVKQMLAEIRSHLGNSKGAHVIVDVDPVNML